jgi:hypothetical protein
VNGENPRTTETKIARGHIAITTITDITIAIRRERAKSITTEAMTETKSADIGTNGREETTMATRARALTKDGIAMTAIMMMMTSAKMKFQNQLPKSVRMI